MAHSETTRINDLIALQIGAIQEFAQELNVDTELQQLESVLASLEKEIDALQQTLQAIPHHSGRSRGGLRTQGAPATSAKGPETAINPEHKVHHEIFPHVSGDVENLS